MEPAELTFIALVAFICGSLAQLTSSYSHGGWIVNFGAACAGALVGVIVSRLLNFPAIYDIEYRQIDFPVIYSLVGAMLFLGAIGFWVKPQGR
jgi:uncharacterized membrane protein YeaQ/YmgE (transglycosylase-associated protein family)